MRKKFRIFWRNTAEPRKDVAMLMTAAVILGFAYPWIAKGVEIVLPVIVKYYDWVSKF